MLELSLSLIDGGAMDIPVTAVQFQQLRAAVIDGQINWDDFTEITTDDWGAPPINGRIHGTHENAPVDFAFGIRREQKRRR